MSIFDSDRDRRAATTPPIEDPYRGLSEHDRDVARRLRDVEDTILVTVGVDGTNGKVGRLTERVNGLAGIWKAIGVALAGVAVTAAGALYTAGQRNGTTEAERTAVRAELAATRAELRELRSDVAEIRLLLPTLRAPARPAGDVP
jgi:hypothetical protein